MSLETDALAFQQRSPNESVSAFACRYPGQYGEAAAALREVRKAESESAEGDAQC